MLTFYVCGASKRRNRKLKKTVKLRGIDIIWQRMLNYKDLTKKHGKWSGVSGSVNFVKEKSLGKLLAKRCHLLRFVLYRLVSVPALHPKWQKSPASGWYERGRHIYATSTKGNLCPVCRQLGGGQSVPLMSVISQLSPVQNNIYAKDVWRWNNLIPFRVCATNQQKWYHMEGRQVKYPSPDRGLPLGICILTW